MEKITVPKLPATPQMMAALTNDTHQAESCAAPGAMICGKGPSVRVVQVAMLVVALKLVLVALTTVAVAVAALSCQMVPNGKPRCGGEAAGNVCCYA